MAATDERLRCIAVAPQAGASTSAQLLKLGEQNGRIRQVS